EPAPRATGYRHRGKRGRTDDSPGPRGPLRVGDSAGARRDRGSPVAPPVDPARASLPRPIAGRSAGAVVALRWLRRRAARGRSRPVSAGHGDRLLSARWQGVHDVGLGEGAARPGFRRSQPEPRADRALRATAWAGGARRPPAGRLLSAGTRPSTRPRGWR